MQNVLIVLVGHFWRQWKREWRPLTGWGDRLTICSQGNRSILPFNFRFSKRAGENWSYFTNHFIYVLLWLCMAMEYDKEKLLKDWFWWSFQSTPRLLQGVKWWRFQDFTNEPSWASNFKLALGDEGEGLEGVGDELVHCLEPAVFDRSVRYKSAIALKVDDDDHNERWGNTEESSWQKHICYDDLSHIFITSLNKFKSEVSYLLFEINALAL